MPRFAAPGSFEFDFGQKWKDLYMMQEDGDRALKRQFDEGMSKLEIEQAGALMEHQTAMLRQGKSFLLQKPFISQPLHFMNLTVCGLKYIFGNVYCK